MSVKSTFYNLSVILKAISLHHIPTFIICGCHPASVYTFTDFTASCTFLGSFPLCPPVLYCGGWMLGLRSPCNTSPAGCYRQGFLASRHLLYQFLPSWITHPTGSSNGFCLQLGDQDFSVLRRDRSNDVHQAGLC